MLGIGYGMDKFWAIYHKIPQEIKIMDGILNLDPFINSKKYHVEDTVNESTDPNSNINQKSIVHYESERYKAIGKVNSYYLLWKYMCKRYGDKRSEEVIVSAMDGHIYIHDLAGIKLEVPYCFALDTTPILFEGRPFGTLKGTPPKRMNSYNGMLESVLRKLSNELAGAIGLGNAFINLAFFTKNETDKQIENVIQSIVHVIHETNRQQGDGMFINASVFDEQIIKENYGDMVYPDNSKIVDNIPEIMRVQKILCEFMARGDPLSGKLFAFPIITANIYTKNGKIVDNDFFDYICDLNNEKYFINIYNGNKTATCCRLTSDMSQLKESIKSDSFGNGGSAIGSHRCITMNLHRIALQSVCGTFFENIMKYMSMVEELLLVHKKDILQRRVDERLFPFFNVKWMRMEQFFSTIGFVGLYDAFIVLYGEYNKERYIEFAESTLKYIEDFAHESGIRNKGMAFNVEEAPAENAGVKLAKKDTYYYPFNPIDILSNQMLPAYKEYLLQDRLEVCSSLSNIVSGGSILHINIDSAMTSQANRDLTRKIIEEYHIPHFLYNLGYSICEQDHVSTGIWETCQKPSCECAIISYYTRIVGYFSTTDNWIKERQDEFVSRQRYKI